MNSHIIILDDDPTFRRFARSALGSILEIAEAGSEEEFRALWVPRAFDLLILDMRLRRDREGLDILREVFAQDEFQPVIMVSAYGDTESAIEAVGAGAMMFLHKQEFTPALLGRMVEAVIEQGRLRRQVHALRRLAWAGEPDTLLGDHPGVREAASRLREAAEDRVCVPVISGERGCGATLTARLIHRYGPTPDGPFVEISGESAGREARFFEDRQSPWTQAMGGSLTVDGAESLSRTAFGEIMKSQSGESITIASPRVVFSHHSSATVEAVARRGESSPQALPGWMAGADHVFPITLPPLRQRRGDIPLLATHFLQRQRAGGHTSARSISGAVMKRLEGYAWPGNVRELCNVMEYAALQATASGADDVDEGHLPASLLGGEFGSESHGRSSAAGWNYRMHLARTEIELADRAVRERGVSQKTALAKALGYTDRFTLMRRIRKALTDFPPLAREFPGVAELFLKTRDS